MPVHSKNPLAIIANGGRLRDIARGEGVDIIHVRSRAPAWSALLAARQAGVALVATYHGAYEARSALKRLYNSAMVRGDLVIANSAFTAAAIRAAYEVNAGRLVVIPRGADVAHFDPAKIARPRVEALARQWGVGAAGGPLRMLLPARLTPWKGHEVAIEAVARLAIRGVGPSTGQRAKLQLIFAGDAQGRDDYAASLRQSIETRGVPCLPRRFGPRRSAGSRLRRARWRNR
jgi:glycosyltransferase involved in cell wall biosynthesis